MQLDIDSIRVDTAHLLFGRDIRYHPTVDSTNRIARDALHDDALNGTVILAEYQAAGRGRGSRTWTARSGTCVLLSTVFQMPEDASAVYATMVGALAVRDTVYSLGFPTVALKWPNDVMLGGRKMCGILAELPASSNRRVVLGIGLNVNLDVQDLAGLPGATSLRIELGRCVDRERVAVRLLTALDRWYAHLVRQPETVYRSWARALSTVGQRVRVEEPARSWEGIATGVQSDGGLTVRSVDGRERTVYAGDVSIRTT